MCCRRLTQLAISHARQPRALVNGTSQTPCLRYPSGGIANTALALPASAMHLCCLLNLENQQLFRKRAVVAHAPFGRTCDDPCSGTLAAAAAVAQQQVAAAEGAAAAPLAFAAAAASGAVVAAARVDGDTYALLAALERVLVTQPDAAPLAGAETKVSPKES